MEDTLQSSLRNSPEVSTFAAILSNRLVKVYDQRNHEHMKKDLLLGACVFIEVVLMSNIFLYYVSNNTQYECAFLK
jgi:hypothetical protein